MTKMSASDIAADIDTLLQGFALHNIRRYFRQNHWLEESRQAEAADLSEPGLKLESVAAHSWHVADTVVLLAGHFPELDAARCMALALLHDRLEAYTGDYDPVGSDGQGTTTHAFDTKAQQAKADEERQALETYIAMLRPALRAEQKALLQEIIDTSTREARFVMAVDKLQALAFVLLKKNGRMTDAHLQFTIRYSSGG